MAENDSIGQATNGSFDAAWNWKNSYASGLGQEGKEYGLEKFSQLSATPDSTALYAGPARFTGIKGAADLRLIGMVDGVNFTSQAQLARLFEIGSNRSYFSRGKTIPSINFNRMLADTPSVMKVLNDIAYGKYLDSGVTPYAQGTGLAAAPGSNVAMNLDSESMAIPFGLLLMFKTRGDVGTAKTRGKVLSAVYLEYCMFSGYNFSLQSSAPVIQEGIGIEFDRSVPVQLV